MTTPADLVAELSRVRRGTVVWIKSRRDPSAGAEIAKSRPAVVISADYFNERSRFIIVVPIKTMRRKPEQWEVVIRAGEGGQDRDGLALVLELFSLDKFSWVEAVRGEVKPATLDAIDAAINLVLGVRLST